MFRLKPRSKYQPIKKAGCTPAFFMGAEYRIYLRGVAVCNSVEARSSPPVNKVPMLLSA
jgi:hypothetical protein